MTELDASCPPVRCSAFFSLQDFFSLLPSRCSPQYAERRRPKGLPMDFEKLEALEAHILRLIDAFRQVKEENKRLGAYVNQLQETVQAQQKELEQLQPERAELARLRSLVQTWQRERTLIRQKLEQMLHAIERLEAQMGDDAKTSG